MKSEKQIEEETELMLSKAEELSKAKLAEPLRTITKKMLISIRKIGRKEAIEEDSIFKIKNNFDKSFFGTFKSALKNDYLPNKNYIIVDWIFFHDLLKLKEQEKKQ